jgi:hypothetical protein
MRVIVGAQGKKIAGARQNKQKRHSQTSFSDHSLVESQRMCLTSYLGTYAGGVGGLSALGYRSVCEAVTVEYRSPTLKIEL